MKKAAIILLMSMGIPLFAQTGYYRFDNTVIEKADLSSEGEVELRANKGIYLKSGFAYSSDGTHEFYAENELLELAVIDPDNMTGGPESVGSEVGTDGVVGKIPGVFNVTKNGAATYTIPIECPPGINGMVPQIALSYNSQAGNGIAGWGWNLSATSSITRVPHTYFYESVTKAIAWSEDDKFAFNGIRMFEESSSGTTKIFKLENDPTMKIEAINWTADGPTSFIVYTADGKKQYFGNSTNSRLFAGSQTQDIQNTLSWNLSKIEDSYGNFIEYIYTSETNTSFRISEIKYTGNGANLPFYKVSFDYESRSDEVLSYVSLKKFDQKKRLSNIKVLYGTTEIRNYQLNYDNYINNYSHLIEIKLIGINGDKYNKTVFKYPAGLTDDSDDYFVEYYYDRSKEIKDISSGDFNGDGVSDICVHYTEVDEFEEITSFYAFYIGSFTTNGVINVYHEATYESETTSTFPGDISFRGLIKNYPQNLDNKYN